ncbi:MAG: alpha/beta fold hydrolase [Desulfobacteraceae bacterium]|nr:alpha/beta fold hydrolase [Desulfobacteraceae bacterium]
MNRFAIYMSSYALKTFSPFSKAKVQVHGDNNIPDGSVIYTANHFTRLETILLPYYIHKITKKPAWSLADAELFQGNLLKPFLENLGAVSTQDPHRNYLITKNLISGDAEWIIFPEGMMVKNKKLISHDHFGMQMGDQIIKPHSGAATIALRCEFYRERLRRMENKNRSEFERLINHFEIKDPARVLGIQTYIVPVNITYYPILAKKNLLSTIAEKLIDNPSARTMDELKTEGSMILSGVNIDIRFGKPIRIKDYLHNSFIESDLNSKRAMDFDRNICSRHAMKEHSSKIMGRFLTSIYEMATINYDHILASILRHLPENLEDEDIYTLKCRLFLAVTRLISKSKSFFHKSLYQNQISLLTDDRYKKIEHFLKEAIDTGIITHVKDKIHINSDKINSCNNFHNVRIENPIYVMANEIEPINEVEELIKRVAEMTPAVVRNRIKNNLVEKTKDDYHKTYNKYYNKEESKEKKIGAPLFLKAENEKAGILLIHGYMAAPEEMRGLAEFFHEKSFTVYVPRLKGHGTSPEDLSTTQYQEWIESVEEGYVILKHTCKKLFVGGFSTGAALALELCARTDDINAAFAVAPPMKLKDLGSHFVPAISLFNNMMKKAYLSKIAKEFIHNDPENPHINYARNPIAGIRELERLTKKLEGDLQNIEVPVLVVQSRKDPVVNPVGTLKLFNKIGSEQKEYFLFDYERHGILLGKGADRIYKNIESFISQFID